MSAVLSTPTGLETEFQTDVRIDSWQSAMRGLDREDGSDAISVQGVSVGQSLGTSGSQGETPVPPGS
jgi:hypothetical protein